MENSELDVLCPRPSIYIPASLGQDPVQPTKWAIIIDSFYWYSGGGLQHLVCGGLPAFHCFYRLSSQILVVICGCLWLFMVVCDGLSRVLPYDLFKLASRASKLKSLLVRQRLY